MQYRTPIAVADTLRRLADGSATADPLRVGDAAELERLAAWAEGRSELQADLRVRLERTALAAYSLGARHVLERYEQIDHSNEMLKLIEEREALKRRIAAEEAKWDKMLAAERVDLETGEVTTEEVEQEGCPPDCQECRMLHGPVPAEEEPHRE